MQPILSILPWVLLESVIPLFCSIASHTGIGSNRNHDVRSSEARRRRRRRKHVQSTLLIAVPLECNCFHASRRRCRIEPAAIAAKEQKNTNLLFKSRIMCAIFCFCFHILFYSFIICIFCCCLLFLLFLLLFTITSNTSRHSSFYITYTKYLNIQVDWTMHNRQNNISLISINFLFPSFHWDCVPLNVSCICSSDAFMLCNLEQ